MVRNARTPLLISVCCAVAILPLAVAAYYFGPLQELDLRIVLHFEYGNQAADNLASVLVHLGDLGALMALSAVVVAIGLYFGRRREVVAALIVVAGANITTQLLKLVFEHTRHMFWEPGVALPWTKAFPSGDSFPSGHTTAAASIAAALLFVVPARHRVTAATCGLILTAAVAISVVVLDWHYPSDVLGGLLVVASWGFAVLAGLRLAPRPDAARGGASATVGGTAPFSTSR
jgi:membrane-associated phospholipid phosphatase